MITPLRLQSVSIGQQAGSVLRGVGVRAPSIAFRQVLRLILAAIALKYVAVAMGFVALPPGGLPRAVAVSRLQGRMETEGMQRNAATFVEDDEEDEDLTTLRRLWLEEIRPSFVPEVDLDPYLTPQEGPDKLLSRFLKAERNQRAKDPVSSAAGRLRDTAAFRRDYRCVDFHRKGMARKLFMHGTNAGASLYFGDAGLRDTDGDVVLVGRTSLMTDQNAPDRKAADKMIPCTHLRAGIFVVERAATETANKASYICDVGSFPEGEMAQFAFSRYWDADGAPDDFQCVQERRRPVPSVGPHLPDHETMSDGLPVLKEALRLVTTHYPELLKRVYFYRPGFIFRTIFNIFSLWVPKETRAKFVMVSEGEEHKHFMAPGVCEPKHAPPEFGGSGAALHGDRFLAAAIDRYDAKAMFPNEQSPDRSTLPA